MANKLDIYEDLKEMVEDEIDKILKKGELDEKCLEYLYKLTDIAKDVETIMAMHEYGGEEQGYSRMYPYYSYDDGMSMKKRPMMDDGYSYRYRDSMGRYARGYSREGDMRMKLEQMMSEATTEHERNAIREALDRM